MLACLDEVESIEKLGRMDSTYSSFRNGAVRHPDGTRLDTLAW